MKKIAKPCTLTIRLSQEQRDRLDELRVSIPYAPTITTIVQRGIELAAMELEEMAEKVKGPKP
jgi:predicted DNA-binding protein